MGKIDESVCFLLELKSGKFLINEEQQALIIRYVKSAQSCPFHTGVEYRLIRLWALPEPQFR